MPQNSFEFYSVNQLTKFKMELILEHLKISKTPADLLIFTWLIQRELKQFQFSLVNPKLSIYWSNLKNAYLDSFCSQHDVGAYGTLFPLDRDTFYQRVIAYHVTKPIGNRVKYLECASHVCLFGLRQFLTLQAKGTPINLILHTGVKIFLKSYQN